MAREVVARGPSRQRSRRRARWMLVLVLALSATALALSNAPVVLLDVEDPLESADAALVMTGADPTMAARPALVARRCDEAGRPPGYAKLAYYGLRGWI